MQAATFDHITKESPNIWTFYFVPKKPISYVAGQYVEMLLAHKNADERGDRRWFTLSSSPTDDLISITTKFATKNGSSFKRSLQKLKPGDTVKVSEAMGDFVLPKDTSVPLIFVAGGIGITPFHSMFSWLADNHKNRNIHLLYAVQTEDELVFQETFQRVNIHARIIVSQPSDEWGGLRGHLTAQDILGLEPLDDKSLIYLSGPEQMVENLEAELKKSGVPKTQIVGDFFPGYHEY